MLILNGSTPRIPILMVDATDDETAETGLTPTVQISKNGGAFANTTNAAVEVANGWYYVALTATESNTDGPLFVRATGTGADEYRDYHQVYTALAGNTVQWHGSDLLTGTGPLAGLGVLDRGTAQADSTTSLQIRSAAAFADDELIGATALIYSATTGAGQRALVSDNVGSTDTLTLNTMVTDPTGTVRYEIYGTAASSGGGGGATADEVVDELYSRVTTDPLDVNVVGWLGTAVDPLEDASEIADVLLSTNNADYDDAGTVGGNIAVGGSGGGGGLDAAGVRAAVGLSAPDLGTRLTLIASYIDTEVTSILNGVTQVVAAVDTEVAGIKAKTDLLTFTKTNELDVNVQSYNDVTLLGNGQPGNLFRV